MSFDYYKNDLSVNDALALLLGMNLRQLRRGRVELLEELERDLADCCTALAEAKETGDEAAIEDISTAVEEAGRDFKYGGELHTKLVGEIAKARKDKPTPIVITHDDPEDKDYDFVSLARQSVLDWADHAKIKVGLTPPPPTRKHTTPLLDLLDELIQEFWEDYEIGRLPTKEAIKTHVKRKCGVGDGDPPSADGPYGFPDLSNTVIEAMITMMRPPELRNKR
jgi:hypothetical protein